MGDLEPLDVLIPPPKFWNYRHALPPVDFLCPLPFWSGGSLLSLCPCWYLNAPPSLLHAFNPTVSPHYRLLNSLQESVFCLVLAESLTQSRDIC